MRRDSREGVRTYIIGGTKFNLWNKIEWSQNMNIEKVVNELLYYSVFRTSPTEYIKLKGGTASDVYHVTVDEKEYVIKSNKKEVIESEANFLKAYKELKYLPDLIFIDKKYQYFVYTFIKGTTDYTGLNKKETLNIVVEELLNHYKSTDKKDMWGWENAPVQSWNEFQIKEVSYAREMIGNKLSADEHSFIHFLAEKTDVKGNSYLLHGDCGFHNFIFEQNQLIGVIDPTPVLGKPIYDLIYAFCSTPNDLTKEIIESTAKKLKSYPFNKRNVYEQVLIGLYIRLETCLVHHPEDFSKYKEAWKYWMELVKNESL